VKIKNLIIFLAIFILMGSITANNASADIVSGQDYYSDTDAEKNSDWKITDHKSTPLDSGTSTQPYPSGATPVNNATTQPYPSGATPVNNATTQPYPSGATPVSEGSGSGVYIPTAEETGLSGASIQAILVNLLRWLLGIVGVVALIGFAISGVQYILAAGNDGMIETAKKNMLNSIMGIVIVLASLVIIQAIDYALRAQGSFF
jgi:hypothetical protein